MSKSNDHGYVNKITSWNGTERFLFFLQMYRMSSDVNKHVPNSEHVHFVEKPRFVSRFRHRHRFPVAQSVCLF